MRAPKPEPKYATRACYAERVLSDASEQDLPFNAGNVSFLDIEVLAVQYVSGALPVVLTLRDSRGGSVRLPVAFSATSDTLRTYLFIKPFENRTQGAKWTVQLSGAGTTVGVYAQGREFGT